MQSGRHITSLMLSKPINSERLQMLVQGLRSLDNIRYLGITGEARFSTLAIIVSLIPDFNLEILAISNGVSHANVS